MKKYAGPLALLVVIVLGVRVLGHSGAAGTSPAEPPPSKAELAWVHREDLKYNREHRNQPACLTAALAPAPAVSGASIQGAPVRAGVLRPGRTYTESVWIGQGGSGDETMTLRLWHDPCGKPGHAVPPSWLQDVPSVTISPGQGQTVHFQVAVPAGARPGFYLSDLEAAEASSGGPSGVGAQLGAGAATYLEFAVATPVTH